jgi:hypothetical protein
MKQNILEFYIFAVGSLEAVKMPLLLPSTRHGQILQLPSEDFNVEFGSFGIPSNLNDKAQTVVENGPQKGAIQAGGKLSFLDVRDSCINYLLYYIYSIKLTFNLNFLDCH